MREGNESWRGGNFHWLITITSNQRRAMYYSSRLQYKTNVLEHNVSKIDHSEQTTVYRKCLLIKSFMDYMFRLIYSQMTCSYNRAVATCSEMQSIQCLIGYYLV